MSDIPNMVASYGSPFSLLIEDYNLLPLETWRDRIGYHPWHFWGMAGPKVPILSACNTWVKQHSWQTGDTMGREDIIKAIISAEVKMTQILNYSPAPRYREAMFSWPRYPKEDIYRYGYAGGDGRWITIRLPEGYIEGVGIQKYDMIQENAIVVYSDQDGDGLNETFTITTPAQTLTQNQSQVEIFFTSADRLDNEPTGVRWQIRPIRTRIDPVTGVVTITGRSWLLARPILYEGFGNDAIDPNVCANFAEMVNVYWRHTWMDGQTYLDCQAALVWETPPYPQWASWSLPAPAGLDPAGVAYAIARVGVRDAQNGVVSLGEAVYDPISKTWQAIPWYAGAYKYKPPDRVVIRYHAGYPTDQFGNMQAKMSEIVYPLAAAQLTRRICACESASRALYDFQFDLSRTAGSGDEAYGMMSRDDLSNPFGTKRGEVRAWKQIKNERQLRGFAVG